MPLNTYGALDDAVHALFGDDTGIAEVLSVSGGDANDAAVLVLSSGDRVFMKSNALSRERFFIAEENGLEAIAAAGAIATPRLYCRGNDRERGFSYLLMEVIRPAERIASFWETFAHELFLMHEADTASFTPGGSFGYTMDNFIGAGEQKNDCRDSWITFFLECRLLPQIRKAVGYFDGEASRRIDRLLERLDRFLVEPEHPSLLHGDLWSGNFAVGSDGKAWLIDPAVYVGHAEADLAMTELFGGFSRSFYEAYFREAHTEPGYEDRRDLYNLYHLLNHLNLFGSGYYAAVMRTVEKYQ